MNIVPSTPYFVKETPDPASAPFRLRADTRMFLGCIVSHLESLVRRAQRGEIDIGCPQNVAALASTFIFEQAPEYLELHHAPVGA